MTDGMLGLFTQGRGLAGLDKKRPWGLLVYAVSEDDFPVVVFVPVTDFKKLVALIPNPETGEPTKPDNKGVCELKMAASLSLPRRKTAGPSRCGGAKNSRRCLSIPPR